MFIFIISFSTLISSVSACCSTINLTCEDDPICRDKSELFGIYRDIVSPTNPFCGGQPVKIDTIYKRSVGDRTYYMYSDSAHDCGMESCGCEWVITTSLPTFLHCPDNILLHSWKSEGCWGPLCPQDYDIWGDQLSGSRKIQARCVSDVTPSPPQTECSEKLKVLCKDGDCCTDLYEHGFIDWDFFGVYENKGYHVCYGELSLFYEHDEDDVKTSIVYNIPSSQWVIMRSRAQCIPYLSLIHI